MCRDAFSATLKRLWRFDFPAFFRSYRQTNGVAFHTVRNTSQKPSQDVRPSIPNLEVAIHRRAIRLHNRSRDGAERYVRVQTILSKGRCYD